jgi:hypothetical protein
MAMNKERLRSEIWEAAAVATMYLQAWAVAYFEYESDVPNRREMARVSCVKLALKSKKLFDLLHRVNASKYDDVPIETQEFNIINGPMGLLSEFVIAELEEAKRIETEVRDAMRCWRFTKYGEGASYGAEVEPGVALLAWRALTEDEKCVCVKRHWNNGVIDRLQEHQKRLARGEKWPTSTFDPVPWACEVSWNSDKKNIVCAKLEGHDGMHVNEEKTEGYETASGNKPHYDMGEEKSRDLPRNELFQAYKNGGGHLMPERENKR